MVNDRVHYFGATGTITDYEDYHHEWAVVRFDSGAVQTVRSAMLRVLTPEAAEVLAPIQSTDQ